MGLEALLISRAIVYLAQLGSMVWGLRNKLERAVSVLLQVVEG